jgi:hypothetical protein
MPMPTPAAAASRLGWGVVGLLTLVTWALTHAYAGLYHDAGLYTLQALAHLRPASLSTDVFLRFGSQDRFTVFGPLYAAAAARLGVEPAAAALTLAFQIGLVAAAWSLARRVLPASMAWLGVAVLIAVPGYYGADRIFACIEPFLTPRMAAEALTLAALAAALGGRRAAALALALAALLFHPLMAMAGASALYWYYGGNRPLAIAGAAFALIALALLAYAMPFGTWGRFDPAWLTLVEERSPYLFLREWSLDDWSRAAVSMGSVIAGIAVLKGPARTLCQVTAATGACGTMVTFVGADLLHGVLLTQLQSWRWQWLVMAVAALLLPAILSTSWRAGIAGRTAALLLVAAWVFGANVYALVAVLAALASLAGLARLEPTEARWAFWGAVTLFAIALAWRIASNLEFTDAYYMDPSVPLWLRRATSFSSDGTVPMGVIAAAWWLGRTPRARPVLIALGVLAVSACAALSPPAWRNWSMRDFAPPQIARFAGVRRDLPSGAEIFWPESPLGAWLLLDHPSYLSVLQTSGLVFSRDAARELKRRADALGAAVDPGFFMEWNRAGTGIRLTAQQQRSACGTGEFDYLVTSSDLGMEPAAAVATPGSEFKKIRVYRCRSSARPM